MHISNKMSTMSYLGGKFSYLIWLLPLIDIPCKHRVDVFGGSGVVGFNLPRAQIETYNDINGKVVNFFRVLREKPEELISVLELTLHSRAEYNNAWFSEDDTDVERARKFFIRTQQSIWASGAQDKVRGWCSSVKESRIAMSEKTHKWLGAIEGLWDVAKRLKTIQIENKDFRYIFRHYDDKDTFFYCDSPYDPTYRSSTKYEFDFVNQDFFDLKDCASKAVGKVALSGYDTPFMSELFKDFIKQKGPRRKNNRSDKEANECLWTNY